MELLGDQCDECEKCMRGYRAGFIENKSSRAKGSVLSSLPMIRSIANRIHQKKTMHSSPILCMMLPLD
jgi:hypothetical protein